ARRLAGELAARGGATPSLWRLDLRCSWQQLGAALARMRELDTFALPVGLQITPAGTTDRFEVSLWTWI
ncbi:MAG: hypothetical protein KDE27_30390, partial [Planctomycetes bacterium]|nr:hypothetical protein [Planctomycetota bacterium]